MDKPFTFPKALLQFVILVIIAWLFMYLVPGQWFVNWYLPMSFFLLMGTVTFGIVGLGWPFGAPGGSWRPGRNRWMTGILQCIVWIAVALVFTAIETWVWPKMPLTGAPTAEGVPALYGVWFGIALFGFTLWYAFDGHYDGADIRPYAKPWKNWLLATIVILIAAGLIWFLIPNLDPTSGADQAFNQGGKWFANDWFSLVVWIIVWIEIFGTTMVFQGWPFYKAGRKLHRMLVTLAALVLGYVCWRFLFPAFEAEGATFGWAAVAASLIGWALLSSLIFGFYPFANTKQPLRGLGLFVLYQLIVPAVWIVLLRYVLGPPILHHINTAFTGDPNMGPADINLVTAWFMLHNLAIWALVHNLFFMRVPFAVPGPPLGPEEVPAPAAK
ncbi:MAG: hypothetical protein GXX83_07445 [Gaiellales bacterium]|nr:hypothetical protein [Gaiellales bacterium]